MTARKTPTTQSWDDFWSEAAGGRRETIRGVEVTVPTDIPLALERRISELQESESEEDFAELIALLFGTDALDRWRENGMGLLELQTLLAWGLAHASGQEITFGEALELVKREQADGGKAPNRAARRAASRAPSASTGGRSKPTSSVSTASARTRSRG